ncbi:MAG: M28 family peptidase [Bacteroidales bacterium]
MAIILRSMVCMSFPLTFFLMACTGGNSVPKTTPVVEVKENKVPLFNADSAYQYVAGQMAFGNRIPNTEAHARTAQWLASELRRHGAEVIVQEAPVTAYDNTVLNAQNIIGQFNPEKKDRVLLLAHWDSRPFADYDKNPANIKKPVPGANDGASGVGVLLEIARLLGKENPGKGIDIMFVDAEDYGTPSFATSQAGDNTWALGTQYWARRPHKPGYRAKYAILLDMVGARNATFLKEGFSNHYASYLVDKVWKTGQKLGYSSYFVEKKGGYINDDHYYVNTMARIPAIDIIHLDPDSETGFFPYWHTVDDTLDKIDPATLEAVGRTVTYLLYND